MVLPLDIQDTPQAAHVEGHSKTSFEKNCFSAWASTLNMGLINKVDMVCLSPVGYGVQLTFRALALRRSRLEVLSVEGVESMFLAHVDDPWLTAIEERAGDACLVDTHLGVLREETVLPHPLGQFGHCG